MSVSDLCLASLYVRLYATVGRHGELLSAMMDPRRFISGPTKSTEYVSAPYPVLNYGAQELATQPASQLAVYLVEDGLWVCQLSFQTDNRIPK